MPLSRSRRTLVRAATLVSLIAVVLGTVPVRASGLYYADRGVRPLGRGGAFIAGGDDLGSIAYNPAGLFEAGAQLMFDGSWMHFSSDYTRQTELQQVDPNTGGIVGTFTQSFPSVRGSTPFLPLPTLAVSFQPREQWVVAFGTWAPYAALTSYPDMVGGNPAPQRYSLLSLDGSALMFVGGGAAYAPTPEWRLGATVGVLTGKFNTTVDFAGCLPERFLCAPEQSSWDVLSQLSAGPLFAPTGELGAIWIPHPSWRAGLSLQLPVYVRAPATLHLRLPSTPVFQTASQDGEDGRVAFDLPWSLRAGVETRAIEHLRVELALNYDRWSMHDAITFNPKGIALKNVAGFPESYFLPPVIIPRHFQDSVAVHLGAEHAFEAMGLPWQARGGLSFETSAIPKEYESVLTIDQSKLTAALGASLHWRQLRFDLTYAHVFGFDVNVDPKDAKIALPSPVQANPPKSPDFINGGSYAARADLIGLGVSYLFR